MMKKYVCVDVGGTAIKYGVLDEKGTVLNQQEMPTEALKGGNVILEKIKNVVQKYRENNQIEGICISTAGIVDPFKGEIIHANENIPLYQGICLKEELEKEFSIPCEVENDVNCAGLAEYYNGAAKESQNALCLTIGTGIGGCAILDGRLLRGSSYSACEIGYMQVKGNEFEKVASTSALVRTVAKKKQDDISSWNGKKILACAEKGDEICKSSLMDMADLLALGISNVCYVLNPDTVVLGGGIMQQESMLTFQIRRSLERYLVPVISSHLRTELAHHHNLAGLIGAWYYYQKRHQL